MQLRSTARRRRQGLRSALWYGTRMSGPCWDLRLGRRTIAARQPWPEKNRPTNMRWGRTITIGRLENAVTQQLRARAARLDDPAVAHMHQQAAAPCRFGAIDTFNVDDR